MRVLQVLGSLHRGGAETMIMNYYRAFDKSQCQMDFVVHAEYEDDYRKEAESMGAKIILLPPVKKIGMPKYIRLLSRVIKENGPYDAVHAHNDYQEFLSVIAACKAGVKNIVVHSHNTRFSKTHLLVNRIIFNLGKVTRVACGEKAGAAFFGKKKYIVLNNAIDAQKFLRYAGDAEFHNKGDLKRRFVIGHFGRFVPQKNHQYIISLAEELKKRNLYAEIRLYGEGELEKSIKQTVKEKGLGEYVKFMGLSKNTVETYRSFDIFILPSLYEGFPVTLVEAQLSGLSALVSDNISRECDLGLGALNYLPLDVSVWADAIGEMMRCERTKKEIDADVVARYDVSVQWKKLLDIYKRNLGDK